MLFRSPLQSFRFIYLRTNSNCPSTYRQLSPISPQVTGGVRWHKFHLAWPFDYSFDGTWLASFIIFSFDYLFLDLTDISLDIVIHIGHCWSY